MKPKSKLLATVLRTGGSIYFDPDGMGESPFIEEVGELLGGLPTTMFDDGTEQFLDEHNGVEIPLSPQLPLADLEAFCEAHIERYRAFGKANAEVLNRGGTVPLDVFW